MENNVALIIILSEKKEIQGRTVNVLSLIPSLDQFYSAIAIVLQTSSRIYLVLE